MAGSPRTDRLEKSLMRADEQWELGQAAEALQEAQ